MIVYCCLNNDCFLCNLTVLFLSSFLFFLETFASFRMPTFYENPRPHVSFAWTVSKCKLLTLERTALGDLGYKVPLPHLADRPKTFVVPLNTIEVKLGNKIRIINLDKLI